MKNAILLCAGSARRFFQDGENQPKCLLALAEHETILDRLLQAVLSRGYHALLGTGCGHEMVSVHLAQHEYSGVRCIFNPDYATTNSIVTLWELRDFVGDETLLINGDLVIGDNAFDLFDETSSPQILTKYLPKFDDDSYRVVFDKQQSVLRMGKELKDTPSSSCAAYTGISRVGNAALFLREIEKLLQSGSNQTWPSTAYRNLISEIQVRAVDIGSSPFFDIDTPQEHEAARLSLATSHSSLPL